VRLVWTTHAVQDREQIFDNIALDRQLRWL